MTAECQAPSGPDMQRGSGLLSTTNWRQDRDRHGLPSAFSSYRFNTRKRQNSAAECIAAFFKILELVEARASRRQQHNRFGSASLPASRAVCSTATASVSEIFERRRIAKRCSKLCCGFADQIGLGNPREEPGQRSNSASFRHTTCNPVDVLQSDDNAGAVASALVALESLTNSTFSARCPTCSMRWARPGKLFNPASISSRLKPTDRHATTAASAFGATAPRRTDTSSRKRFRQFPVLRPEQLCAVSEIAFAEVPFWKFCTTCTPSR